MTRARTNEAACPVDVFCPMSTITVLIAPGPQISGIASGTIAGSEPPGASLSSPAWPPPTSIRIAIAKKRMPPAIRGVDRDAEHFEDEPAPDGEDEEDPERHGARPQGGDAPGPRAEVLRHRDEDGCHGDRVDDGEERREREQPEC